MKCPKCHADNSDTSRFCSNCTTALTRVGQPAPALTKTVESPAYALTKGSLAAGKYRIIEEIGRGGMGVVYKAEDTKLARKVAIKVLPEVFTQDPERLARFEREARVLASLNHPNIAAIYGVEEADVKRFLVLELVEGETLAERLSRGALSFEETLDVCRQIAEGLEGAHEKGIIHRDLKPSNVKITPERKVKILDFGLAKAFRDQISEVDLSKSPTITADMTQPGVILGTAAYMSPEQATGRPVDKRTNA
jgi:serine/threonine-protein kinase